MAGAARATLSHHPPREGAGAAVLAGGSARVRVREFAIGIALHVAVAAAGLSMDRSSAQVPSNIVVIIAVSVVGLFAAYTTERRERCAFLVQYDFAVTSDLNRRAGECLRRSCEMYAYVHFMVWVLVLSPGVCSCAVACLGPACVT
jgi:hypothetical protein